MIEEEETEEEEEEEDLAGWLAGLGEGGQGWAGLGSAGLGWAGLGWMNKQDSGSQVLWILRIRAASQL